MQQHHIHCSSTGSDCQSLSLALRSASQPGALPNCCLHTAPIQLSGSYAVHMQHTPYPHSFHANLNTPPTRSCMQPLHSPHVAAADTRSDTLLASSRGGIGGGWGAGVNAPLAVAALAETASCTPPAVARHRHRAGCRGRRWNWLRRWRATGGGIMISAAPTGSRRGRGRAS